MGERLLCKQEVIGSIPFTSTNPVGHQLGAGERPPSSLGMKSRFRGGDAWRRGGVTLIER